MTLKPGQKVRLVRLGDSDAYRNNREMLGFGWSVLEAHKNNNGSYNGYFEITDSKYGWHCFAEAYFKPVEGRNKM